MPAQYTHIVWPDGGSRPWDLHHDSNRKGTVGVCTTHVRGSIVCTCRAYTMLDGDIVLVESFVRRKSLVARTTVHRG